MACRSDAPTIPDSAPVSLHLAIHLAFVPPEPYVEIRAHFLVRDGDELLPVTPRYIPVTVGSQKQQPVAVDILPCLTSTVRTQRIPGACELLLELRLIGNGDLLDTQQRRIIVQPGEQATVQDVILGAGGAGGAIAPR